MYSDLKNEHKEDKNQKFINEFVGTDKGFI